MKKASRRGFAQQNPVCSPFSLHDDHFVQINALGNQTICVHDKMVNIHGELVDMLTGRTFMIEQEHGRFYRVELERCPEGRLS